MLNYHIKEQTCKCTEDKSQFNLRHKLHVRIKRTP